MKLKNKVAIVTGITRGIGRAIGLELLKLDYKIVGVYLQSEKLAKQLERKNKNIIALKADVGVESDVKRVIKTAIQKFGSVDVVINNAGIDIFGPIEKYKTRDWEKMIDVNLKSIFLFSKYAMPLLKKSKNGVIINISSRIGFPEYTEPEFVVYGAVKAGVTSFTAGLAKEIKNQGIRVNAVIPTPTKTDLFDEVFTPKEEKMLKEKGKLGKPEEVAKLVSKLILDKSSTGKILIDKRVYL